MLRLFNCCVFNHPCPVFCPLTLYTPCSNAVINPTIDEQFGFFNIVEVGRFGSGQVVTVYFVHGKGDNISEDAYGKIKLLAGTYAVTYFVEGVVPENGTVGVRLDVESNTVDGSAISTSQTAGNTVNMTQTVVVTLSQNGVLSLVNDSANETDFKLASVFVEKM